MEQIGYTQEQIDAYNRIMELTSKKTWKVNMNFNFMLTIDRTTNEYQKCLFEDKDYQKCVLFINFYTEFFNKSNNDLNINSLQRFENFS